MPQPKSSSSAARKPAARKPAAKKPAASRSAAAKKPAARKTTAAASRSAAAKKPAARKPAAKKAAPKGDLVANITALRDRLTDGVVITRDRLQEVTDEAVESGRMRRADAEKFVKDLLSDGRKQTQDFLADIEQLIGRSRKDLETAATDARKQATRRGDRVLKQVDKARRRAAPGSFPILGYDDLTAPQIVDRIVELTAAQLRKVRDYETRNASRKSVLSAVERRLK